jgi:sirohydrochlorin cobaltochelatase
VERIAVLILGHGSRAPRANAEFEALVGAFRRSHPHLDVGHAYIELAAPRLAGALAEAAARAERVVVLPLFLLAAGHVKDDLPAALVAARGAFPRVRFEAAGSLGVANRMTELALARSAERVPLRGPEAARTALLVVGRGSSDPDANSDLCKLTRLLGERAGFARAEPCFIAVTSPLFEPAVEDLAKVHDGPILVQPYFLFEGLLAQQLAREVAAFRSRHPGRRVSLAPHLGSDSRLIDLLEERLAEVLGGRARLPCDTCPRSAA